MQEGYVTADAGANLEHPRPDKRSPIFEKYAFQFVAAANSSSSDPMYEWVIASAEPTHSAVLPAGPGSAPVAPHLAG